MPEKKHKTIFFTCDSPKDFIWSVTGSVYLNLTFQKLYRMGCYLLLVAVIKSVPSIPSPLQPPNPSAS